MRGIRKLGAMNPLLHRYKDFSFPKVSMPPVRESHIVEHQNVFGSPLESRCSVSVASVQEIQCLSSNACAVTVRSGVGRLTS